MKMHSSTVYKGYALYKIDGKNTLQQQNSIWCPFTANVFSEFCLLLFREIRHIFLLYVFSKHVHISVLSLRLFAGLCVAFLYIFHSVLLTFDWTYGIFFRLVFNFMHFCLDTVKSNMKDGKESNSKERASHERDSNSQCDKHVA